jgi:hypothetical protein
MKDLYHPEYWVTMTMCLYAGHTQRDTTGQVLDLVGPWHCHWEHNDIAVSAGCYARVSLVSDTNKKACVCKGQVDFRKHCFGGRLMQDNAR